jgi:hypothetical protein
MLSHKRNDQGAPVPTKFPAQKAKGRRRKAELPNIEPVRQLAEIENSGKCLKP